MKLCKDCKWCFYTQTTNDHLCTRSESVNLVTGDGGYGMCAEMRSAHMLCGPRATLFEPAKPSQRKMVLNIVLLIIILSCLLSLTILTLFAEPSH